MRRQYTVYEKLPNAKTWTVIFEGRSRKLNVMKAVATLEAAGRRARVEIGPARRVMYESPKEITIVGRASL